MRDAGFSEFYRANRHPNRREESDKQRDSQEKTFKVALPVSLEAVFQTSLGFIDQIIVGTLGSTAIAAVGLCNSISFIVMLLYSAIGTGCGVLVAQAFGRNDLNERVAALSLMSSGIFGICTASPLILYPGTILKLGFILRLSVWGIFGSRALEEVLKTIFFLMRYRTPAWYKKSVDELRPAAAKQRVAHRDIESRCCIDTLSGRSYALSRLTR